MSEKKKVKTRKYSFDEDEINKIPSCPDCGGEVFSTDGDKYYACYDCDWNGHMAELDYH